MRFAYFVPNRATKPPEELLYAFEGLKYHCVEVGNGPTGMGTLIVVDSDLKKFRSINQETQAWRLIPGTKNWIGWLNDDKPKPEDLKRDTSLESQEVELHDGNKWLVPMARRVVGDNGDASWMSALPITYDLSDEGKWVVGDVIPKYERLWRIAYEVVDKWVVHEDNEAELQIQDVCEYACEVLSFNYRVSRIEVVALKLLNDEKAAEILAALLDLRVEKKSAASDTFNTQNGVTDETEVIDQPILTSS